MYRKKVRLSDTLFLSPSILSKWSGLRELVELLRVPGADALCLGDLLLEQMQLPRELRELGLLDLRSPATQGCIEGRRKSVLNTGF